MGKKSYTNGRKFEEALCKYFAEKDYYVIYNEKGVAGSQPVDIVIIKNNIATMIEAKNLENHNGIFNLDRVEQNQVLAYNRYRECQNYNFVLAIYHDNKVWFIDFGLLPLYNKSIDLKQIEPNIVDFYKEDK